MVKQGPIDPEFAVTTSTGERRLSAYTEEGFSVLADLWTRSGWEHKLSYEVTWLGVPIIQLPEDILMIQELIWKTRPTVIIESGIAHGGALLLYSSLLELIGRGRVIGIDVDIRKSNRLAIESHPMSNRITLLKGSSVDPSTVDAVRNQLLPDDKVMIALDSNHSRQHVEAELELYSPMVTPGQYLVVFDTVMSSLIDAPNGKASWAEDSPLPAIQSFLSRTSEFEPDPSYERLRVTYCKGGFLRRRTEDSG